MFGNLFKKTTEYDNLPYKKPFVIKILCAKLIDHLITFIIRVVSLLLICLIFGKYVYNSVNNYNIAMNGASIIDIANHKVKDAGIVMQPHIITICCLVVLIVLGIGGLYYIICYAKYGRTVGQKTLNLYFVKVDKYAKIIPLKLSGVVARYLLSFVTPICLCLTILVLFNEALHGISLYVMLVMVLWLYPSLWHFLGIKKRNFLSKDTADIICGTGIIEYKKNNETII